MHYEHDNTNTITASNITINQLRNLGAFINKGKQQTLISTGLTSIISFALSNRTELPPNWVEINKDRNCRTNPNDHSDLTITSQIQDRISSPIAGVNTSCYQCAYGPKGILKDIRRSTCNIAWTDTQKLLNEFANDEETLDGWENFKLPGSTGYTYFNNGRKLNIGINFDGHPQDFRLNSFGGDTWTRRMGVLGFNIGNYRFIKNGEFNPLTHYNNTFPLIKIPYEIVSYPNQFYSMATAACLIEDKDIFENYPYPCITNVGGGSGYLSILTSKFCNTAYTNIIEIDEQTHGSELQANLMLNNLNSCTSLLFNDISDINPATLRDTSHLIANIGNHYGSQPFEQTISLIDKLPKLEYVCLGGFSDRDLSSLNRMQSKGFHQKTVAIAPMLKEIARLQKASLYLSNSNSYEGFTSVSFVKK
jgi:hypothetical protein